MKIYNYFLLFFVLLSQACKIPFAPVSNTQTLYSVKDTSFFEGSSAIERMLKPYRDSLTGIMNEVIGKAEGDLIKEKPGGSLGNMVTKAMFSVAKNIDNQCVGAICNYGGIRIPEIKKGNITKGKIFELLPFENELVILEIRGEILEQWLDLIAKAGGWPILLKNPQGNYNRTLSFRNNILEKERRDTIYKEAGQGILEMYIETNNIQSDVIYHIATNDYIANGGDNCDLLKGQKRINTGLLLRDIIIDDIRKKKSIQPDNQPGMIIIK